MIQKSNSLFFNPFRQPHNLKDIFKFRKILSNRERCQALVDPNQTVYIDKCVERTADYNLFEGHFKSPLVDYLPVPKACQISKFQLIEPSKAKLKKVNLDSKIRPAVVHLAGTGMHLFRYIQQMIVTFEIIQITSLLKLRRRPSLLETKKLYVQTAARLWHHQHHCGESILRIAQAG